MVVLLSSCLIAMVSCDKIDAPYTDDNINIITDSIPVFPSLSANYYNKVLLEEYTGIKCVYCPTGSQIARNLKTVYGDTLILMEVHCGEFASPDANFTADFRTTAGTDFDTKFGMSNAGLPDGMINRFGFPGNTHILYMASWGTAVATAKQKPVSIALQIINKYQAPLLKTYIKTTFKSNLSKNLMLSIFIIEDSLISPQKNNNSAIGPTPVDSFYVHNHVLRNAINSTWGAELATIAVPVVQDSSIIKSYSYTINPAWNAQNCNVVAIVYDKDTYEIYHVEELKLQ